MGALGRAMTFEQFEEPERSRLLALLNGSEKAVRQIEEAITRYAVMLPMARAAKQKPTEVKRDADELHQALQTLVRIIGESGEAWQNVKAAAAAEGLADTVFSLAESMAPGRGEPGDTLVRVAADVADDLKPAKKRPRSPDKVSRFVLMFHTANAARDAGVLVSRNSTAFQDIAAVVFSAAGIPQDPEHDIREYLEAFSQ